MNAMVQRCAGRSGFSLLETLIATAVLAIACLGLAASFTSSTRMSELIRNEGIASNAVNEKIAELRADIAYSPEEFFSSLQGTANTFPVPNSMRSVAKMAPYGASSMRQKSTTTRMRSSMRSTWTYSSRAA